MHRKMYCLFLFAVALAFVPAATAFAQKQPIGFYRLDFVLRESDNGKLVNTRNYSMWLKTDGAWATLRAGNDIPSYAGDKPGLSYRNVGVQLDSALEEIDNNPSVTISASIGIVLPAEQSNEPKSLTPVFRNIAFKAAALLTPGKPMMISSIDDPNSTRRYQLEVTATKLKKE